jgi:manganese/zinc/iron transport system permease protein
VLTNRVALTSVGAAVAARLVHEHRLWELYLITHAEIAPSRVDRDADAIEHVLEPSMIEQLEELLEQSQAVHGVAQSPHPMVEGNEPGLTPNQNPNHTLESPESVPEAERSKAAPGDHAR